MPSKGPTVTEYADSFKERYKESDTQAAPPVMDTKLLETVLKSYENQFESNRKLIVNALNAKQMKQKAFARAVNAALLHGMVDDKVKHNLQSENEINMAFLLDQAMNLKFMIKNTKEIIQNSTKGVENVNKE